MTETPETSFRRRRRKVLRDLGTVFCGLLLAALWVVNKIDLSVFASSLVALASSWFQTTVD